MTNQPFDRVFRILVAVLVIAAARAADAQHAKDSLVGPAEVEADFYRIDKVQTVRLQVADDDWKRMLEALPERIYVRAGFQWQNHSLRDVAIRFKGNSSSAPSQQHKRSFLIKFDEYVDDQQFLGLRRVSFDNGVQFGSVFSEPIITEILRDQGIKAPRSNYAKLFLNGKYQGLYVNVERIDETFIRRQLPDPNGLLFKVDEGGPGSNLQFLGPDPSAYERAFEAETKSTRKGRLQLVDFIGMINQTSDQDFAAKLEAKMELDDFLKVTAVMLFSGAFDQLTGSNPHNYYLYYDGRNERWRYIPWDLDVGFCETAFGQVQVLNEWNAAWPVANSGPNPLLERIIADPVLLKRYRKTARMILDKYFEPERLCAIIDARYALIKEDLVADPFPHRRVTNPEDRSYDDIVASMKSFVRKRYASARQQLENPGQRPKYERRPGPPPQFVDKIQRIMRAAERIKNSGKDLRPIQNVMERVGPLVQQGRFDDAEKLVNEALKLAGEESGQ